MMPVGLTAIAIAAGSIVAHNSTMRVFAGRGDDSQLQ